MAQRPTPRYGRTFLANVTCFDLEEPRVGVAPPRTDYGARPLSSLPTQHGCYFICRQRPSCALGSASIPSSQIRAWLEAC